MAGLSDSKTVDVVAQDPNGHYIVVMVEDRPWGVDTAQPVQLREKINAYADFIFTGDFARHYPDVAGQYVSIQLDCVAEPVAEIAAIVEHARAQLDKVGVGFRVNVRS